MMYHVSSKEAADSIRQYGLDNTRSVAELWSNIDDWEDGVYLWDSLPRAESYARDLGDMGTQSVIYQIDVHDLDLIPDDTGVDEVEGAWYTRHVPADRLKLVG
jgi:hypothetical protein